MDADSLNALATIGTIIAAAVAVVAAAFARSQAREAKRQRELGALIPLFAAHQSPQNSEIRQLIRTGEITSRLSVDDSTRFNLRIYINQLNFIALLVQRKLADKYTIEQIFGSPALICWRTCKDYICKTRSENTEFAAELERWLHKDAEPCPKNTGS